MQTTLSVLQTFVDNLPEGVLLLDSSGNIIVYNDEALELLDTSVEELLLKPLTEQPYGQELLQAINGTGTSEQSHLIISHNSRTLNCAVKCVANLTSKGKQIIITLSDAHALVRIEELKKEFISAILHRIRSPIATLQTTLSVLADIQFSTIGNEAKDVIRMSQHEVERLNILLNSLRDLFIIETGLINQDLTIERFEIINAFEHSLKKTVQVHPQSLSRIKLEGDLKMKISADFQRFCRVLELIIDNAVVFSDDIINITIQPREEYGQIQMKDFGIGVSAENTQYLFSKYFREDNPVTRKVQGNGLGLFIARAWIESMGGSISCESIKNQGTTFTITIPLAKGSKDEF